LRPASVPHTSATVARLFLSLRVVFGENGIKSSTEDAKSATFSDGAVAIRNKMNSEVSRILNTTPLISLQDAHGMANDVPVLVAQMLSTELSERRDAVNALLYSKAYHQFDIYPVTPEIVNVAIHLLKDPSIANLPVSPPCCLEDELVHFCRICAEGETADESIQNRIASLIRENRDVVIKRTVSSLQRTVGDAEWVAAFCTPRLFTT
jgi:hypothetical protein